MKILITGDLHYTNKTPERRLDDYPTTLKNKIRHILSLSLLYNVDAIFQPGDLTDTPFLDYANYMGLFDLLAGKFLPIYTIYGQHDLKYRNKGNTPVDALNQTLPYFHLAENTEPVELQKDINLYSVSYGEDIPKITTSGFNILMIHKMILFKVEQEWQECYDLGTDFLSKNNFDLIISGDNHQSFKIEKTGKNKRYLFNCGSLMRSTIAQIDHEPCFYCFDTTTRTYTQHMIPIKPWQECFDLEKKIKEEENSEKMKAYVQGLLKHKSLGLNFKDNLLSYLKINKIGTTVSEIIQNNMEVRK